jgi:hypothetical protein
VTRGTCLCAPTTTLGLMDGEGRWVGDRPINYSDAAESSIRGKRSEYAIVGKPGVVSRTP